MAKPPDSQANRSFSKASKYCAWCENLGASSFTASRTRESCLLACSSECLVESIEPSLSCIGLIVSTALESLSQEELPSAQLACFLAVAKAAALPPATQETMFIQKFLLSSSSIESSPNTSLSAKTTTRPSSCLTAATNGASAGYAEGEVCAMTSTFSGSRISKTPAR